MSTLDAQSHCWISHVATEFAFVILVFKDVISAIQNVLYKSVCSVYTSV